MPYGDGTGPLGQGPRGGQWLGCRGRGGAGRRGFAGMGRVVPAQDDAAAMAARIAELERELAALRKQVQAG